MTCDELMSALDAYRAGTIDPAQAEALEVHAAGCDACEVLLEQLSRGGLPSFAPALPLALRSQVLGAVAQQRRRRRRSQWVRAGAAIGAAALLAIMLWPAPASAPRSEARPASMPAAEFSARSASAEDRARSEFRALDDAARELEAALARTPGDLELGAFLRSVNDQRAALRRQVQDARS